MRQQEENSPSVIHSGKGLTLIIPTPCPAALHSSLLKGITVAIKHHLLYPADNKADSEAVAILADLQLTLLPDEGQLNKLFE